MPACTCDPKKDRFIASDLVGGDDWVISEEKDILVLGAAGGVRTVTPDDFARQIPYRAGS